MQNTNSVVTRVLSEPREFKISGSLTRWKINVEYKSFTSEAVDITSLTFPTYEETLKVREGYKFHTEVIKSSDNKAMNGKTPYKHFFKSVEVERQADLVVTKVEDTGMYFVHKMRGASSGVFLDERHFRQALSNSCRPIVLSDNYIDLD